MLHIQKTQFLTKKKGTLIKFLENNTVNRLFTTNSLFKGNHEKNNSYGGRRIMNNTMALLLSDTYKQKCHSRMYPKGLTKLVSYWVPRRSMLENRNKMVFFRITGIYQRIFNGIFPRKFLLI